MTDVYAKYTRLKFDRPHPRVLRITMDNGRMNSADDAMHRELADIWRDVDRDPTVNAAIITGAGKVFSAGGDFKMIQSNIDDYTARTRQWKEAREIVYNVINCSKPVVSAMRGVAVGAGLVCGIWRTFRLRPGTAGSSTAIRVWVSPPAIMPRSSGRCSVEWRGRNIT
jgi:enoyl-CoA hydratase